MPIDPLGGRVDAPAEAAPYRNALTITPDDDADLPVIPSAFYIPAYVPGRWSTSLTGPTYTAGNLIVDQAGEIVMDAEGEHAMFMNEFPWHWGCGQRPAEVALILQNGEAIMAHAPSAADRRSEFLILPFRPRRILRTGTTVHQITLLW